jgi:pimeloyl-ACP methyl ester carboxylesterase
MKIQVNTIDIDYSRTGDGDITLLFVHGAFINKEYWADQLEYFKINYTAIAPDLPGHGASGKNKSDWTIESYGDDIATFIEALNLENVILIGHSMAADIVLEVAVKGLRAVLGVIIIDNLKTAGTSLPREVMDQVDTILQNLRTDFANTTEGYVRQGLVTKETDPSLVHRVVEDFRNAYQPMALGAIQSSFTFAPRERELLQRLQQKIYIINVDYIPTNEELLKQYASGGYELHQIHGTSHYPMLEEAQVLNEALEKVIDTIASASLKEHPEHSL